MTQAPRQTTRWIVAEAIPTELRTSAFIVEPLQEMHAELDYRAFMSCRARLRKELQWGDWPPPDFTLRDNRDDLRDHFGEFTRGEAFAYTMLRPDRGQCLGCIYIERCADVDGAQLAFWVIDDAMEIELLVLRETLNWLHDKWSMRHVLVPLRDSNSRGLDIAHKLKLQPWSVDSNSALSNHVCFLSSGQASS